MQKIIPFLWFEKNMKQITDFYSSVFPGAKVTSNGEISDTPSGTVQMATLTLYGQDFSLMTAGPYLPFNPAVSFIVNCDSTEEVDSLWKKLSVGGKVLMELSSYPFAEKYGWLQDKYNVSWQIILSSKNKNSQKIVPTLMFAGKMCGKAEEAVNFYTSVFHNSKISYISKYGEDGAPMPETNATVMHSGFTIENFNMALMDSGKKSDMNFDQAVSFMVMCDNQAEIDYYWDKLTAGGKEVQCGWLSDKFGLPWQVVPKTMNDMLSKGTKEQNARVTAAFMKMKKFDLKTLEDAFNQSN